MDITAATTVVPERAAHNLIKMRNENTRHAVNCGNQMLKLDLRERNIVCKTGIR